MARMMTTDEAAEKLDVNPSRIRQLCISGELTARKIGRDWIIDARDIEAYAKRRRRPGRPRKSDG